MGYLQNLEAIKSLNVPSGVTKRFDCIFCKGRNTLGVTNRNGKLSWHCFRASCGQSGKGTTELTISELTRRVKNEVPKFTLPNYITHVSNPDAMEWLERWHCLSAISRQLVSVRYDPKEHRVIFLIKNPEGEVVDAAGRALKPNKLKWKRYGNSNLPLVVGDAPTAIITEDAASACAVSEVATGVALLGTHLSIDVANVVRKFDNCIIALDPDANIKALKLSKILAQYLPTKTVFLPDDPKAFNKQALQHYLNL